MAPFFKLSVILFISSIVHGDRNIFAVQPFLINEVGSIWEVGIFLSKTGPTLECLIHGYPRFQIFDDFPRNPVYLGLFLLINGESDILSIVFIIELAKKVSHICLKR